MRRVLEAYRKTPGTMRTVRRPDRVVVMQLHQRGVSVSVIENAFVLAAARCLMRPADAPPLGAIRSLAFPAGDRGSTRLACTSAGTTSDISVTSSNGLHRSGSGSRVARHHITLLTIR
jgi:hypothetical protein